MQAPESLEPTTKSPKEFWPAMRAGAMENKTVATRKAIVVVRLGTDWT